MSFGDFVGDLAFYYQSGGFVMPPLVVATVLMWYGLGYRIAVIKRGSDDPVRSLVDRVREKGVDAVPKRGIVPNAVVVGLEAQARRLPNLRDHLDVAFGRYRQLMKGFSVMTQSIIAIAPLLGLLGTVVGMVETFDSLQDMQLFSQTGGIAGGISQALITTQFGLAIAIPGLVVQGFLTRRAQRIEVDLAQLTDLLCAEDAENKNQELRV